MAEDTTTTTGTEEEENQYTIKSTGQSLVPDEPQTTDEVNVVDYMGTQAISPETQPYTQILDQLKELGVSDDELLKFQDAYKLDTESGQITYTPIEAAQIEAPELPETKTVTGETVDLVEKPDLTKTEALKVYQEVSDLADTLSAAKLDLNDIDPRATVLGQMEILNKQLEGGKVPGWAQGAVRQTNALMAKRGITGSSMAAEAMTNALLTSVVDVSRDNSAFYQQVTIENLTNQQQTEMTKFGARVDAIFNDQAAENTARNINATNENELNQFYTQLAQSVANTNVEIANGIEQFNATATNQANQFLAELDVAVDKANMEAINDMAQFDAEMVTNIAQFTETLKNDREKFNIANQMAVDANNIQWKRDVNTANTSSYNAALQYDVQNMLDLQASALSNIWGMYDTLLNMAYKSEESALDRTFQLTLQTMKDELATALQNAEGDDDLIAALFNAGAKFAGTETGSGVLKDWFGL
jgi:hypothetical protein